MNERIPIQKFTDYRAYLLAHAQDMKKVNRSWSFGVWARRLGLKNTSSITKVVQGTRNPGNQMVERLVQYFCFRPKDADYFRDLIRLHKIKDDPRLSVLLMEKMSKTHPDGSIRLLDDKTFQIVSNWYHFSIREMVRLDTFFEDPDWISKTLRFKVTPREISQAITALLQTGLLVRDEKNGLRVSEGRINTSNDIGSEAIKRYHEQMLIHAQESVRLVPVEEREIRSSSVVIRSKNLKEAKEWLRKMQEEFCRTFEEEKGDSLYQIQIQLFPITKKITTPALENQNETQ